MSVTTGRELYNKTSDKEAPKAPRRISTVERGRELFTKKGK